jgi:hypothetical protein
MSVAQMGLGIPDDESTEWVSSFVMQLAQLRTLDVLAAAVISPVSTTWKP